MPVAIRMHQFQTRFNIPYIGEFYGSTEGNVLFFNMADQSGVGRGAMGRHGYLMRYDGHCCRKRVWPCHPAVP